MDDVDGSAAKFVLYRSWYDHQRLLDSCFDSLVVPEAMQDDLRHAIENLRLRRWLPGTEKSFKGCLSSVQCW